MIRRRGDDGESIFSTRDFVRFRRVPTPIASILKKIWALLTAEGADGFAMRRSFAHCIAGRELSNLEAVQYDDQLKDIFNAPPTVVLIQGSLLPGRLAPRQEQSETGSPNMEPTAQPAPNVPDPAECVYLPYFLHTELVRTIEEGEETERANLGMMVLGSVMHETAHWLYTKVHGVRPSEDGATGASATFSSGSSISSSERSFQPQRQMRCVREDDHKILQGQDRYDCGTIATDMSVGAFINLLSWADGENQVVCRRIDPPVRKGQPALTPALRREILGGEPNIFDVTGMPHAPVASRPNWSEHQDYKIISQTAPNYGCNHGACLVATPGRAGGSSIGSSVGTGPSES